MYKLKKELVEFMYSFIDNKNVFSNLEYDYEQLDLNGQIEGKYDNIAFWGKMSGRIKTNDSLVMQRIELLNIMKCLKSLNEYGRCVMLVPLGVLFGISKQHLQTRKYMVDNKYLEQVIYLPNGALAPFSFIGTAILVFNKSSDFNSINMIIIENLETFEVKNEFEVKNKLIIDNNYDITPTKYLF